jgi:hypothetical protein
VAAAAFAGAQQVPIVDVELPAEPVHVRLDDAVLTVRQVADGTAALRELADTDTVEAAVEVVRLSGVVTVTRRSGTQRRAILELEVPDLGGVQVVGRQLELQLLGEADGADEPRPEEAPAVPERDPSTITDPQERKKAMERARLEEAAELRAEEARVFGDPLRPPSLRQETSRPALVLVLTSSAASVIEVPVPVHVDAVDSSVDLERCRGGVTFVLKETFATARGVEGGCELDLESTELVLERVHGDVTGAAVGGSVRAVALDGTVRGELTETSLELEGSSAVGAVTVNGGGVALRRSTLRRFEVAATESTVLLEEVEGAVDVQLSGGRLESAGVAGKLSVEGRAAEVDVRDAGNGVVSLGLYEGSRGRLLRAGRAMTVTVEDGELTVDGGGTLALSALQADVAVLGVERLSRLAMVASEARLDLTGVRGHLRLQLDQDSWAQVDVSTPCQVRLSGRGGLEAAGVDVSGCELVIGNRRVRRPARGVSGEAPVVLTVVVDESSDVDVTGRP